MTYRTGNVLITFNSRIAAPFLAHLSLQYIQAISAESLGIFDFFFFYRNVY